MNTPDAPTQSSLSSQTEPGGNTKTPGKKTPNYQQYRWFLTIPYELIDGRTLSQHFKEIGCKKFTFQGERGEGGFNHWQAEVSLEKKEYFHTFKNALGIDKAHIEPTASYFAAKAYCTKLETRIEGPYTENTKWVNVITELRPWQQTLLDELKTTPNDRTIIWYYDQKGGMGKTQFAKYLALKLNANVISNGKSADIAYTCDENMQICICNFSREIEGRVNYGSLEAIKDGMIFSPKYESKMLYIDSPHVVIFANFLPKFSALSHDRWVIRDSEGATWTGEADMSAKHYELSKEDERDIERDIWD